MAQVSTHLMFQGDADAALSLYGSVFTDFHVESDARYGAGENGPTGTVKTARVSFAGHRLVVIDSPISHAFDFTPSVSLFVEFGTTDEMTAAFGTLSEGGAVLMPPDDYGFSARFAWIQDRFGVSWQLSVP